MITAIQVLSILALTLLAPSYSWAETEVFSGGVEIKTPLKSAISQTTKMDIGIEVSKTATSTQLHIYSEGAEVETGDFVIENNQVYRLNDTLNSDGDVNRDLVGSCTGNRCRIALSQSNIISTVARATLFFKMTKSFFTAMSTI